MKEGIALSKSLSADVFLYNGTNSRDYDCKFIDTVEKSKKHSTAILFLVTDGGDPDAGYKMSFGLFPQASIGTVQYISVIAGQPDVVDEHGHSQISA